MLQAIRVVLAQQENSGLTKMKGNRGIYILIPLVVIVWGILIYRIFSNKIESKGTLINTGEAKAKFTEIGVKDFQLSLNYRDPFLGNLVHKPTFSRSSKNVVPTTAIVASKARLVWPQISLLGMFKNKKEGKELAMLSINNQSYSLKPGELAVGVFLNKIYKDSVQVTFNKERKIIRKW